MMSLSIVEEAGLLSSSASLKPPLYKLSLFMVNSIRMETLIPDW